MHKGDLRKVKVMTNQDVNGHGIQSLEIGLEVLKKIAEQDKPLTNAEISRLCNMSTSKLHRYLTSFCRAGFLEKRADLRYSLGTDLILLGLKASEGIDVKERAVPYLAELREKLNETVALCLWGEHGPFFIRWEESQRAINVGIKVGTQIKVSTSAAGKVFAAFLPKERTSHLIEQELGDQPSRMEQFYKEIQQVKEQGYAAVVGTLLSGLSAVSCPVFDQTGQIVAAILVVGLVGDFDASSQSEAIKPLVKSCAHLSRELGYQRSLLTSL